MLTGLHFLLTYMCNSECDHCFLYCSPYSRGTFTLKQIRRLLDEAKKTGTIETIYFEGGEAFLYYPVMLEGIKYARDMGFKAGVVTNAYFATDEEDIRLWLKPLLDLGISDLSLSNDPYHYESDKDNPSLRAQKVAKEMGIPVIEIRIEEPSVLPGEEQDKGTPVIGGSTKFRGRAVEKLISGLPKRNREEFTECPYEELESPARVHVDSFGNLHICQGISMGNAWETSLSELVKNYNAASHPICGPLVRGGPAQLAAEYGIRQENEYVDACHLCFDTRKRLLDRFPQYLAPAQVYGPD